VLARMVDRARAAGRSVRLCGGGFGVLSWLRSRTLVLACVFVLAALSLRPFPPVERAVDFVFTPAAWAREVLRPLGWLDVREVRAALTAAEEALPAEREAARALLLAQIEAALPADPALRAGRGFLVAEVLERFPNDNDLLRVRFPPGAGVVPDMPVVCGDAYVGRVREVDARRAGEGVVQLVTDERLRVGAAVVDGAGEPAGLVVGGLVEARARRGGLLQLGARHESRPVQSGTVRVREWTSGPRAARRAHADGFRLGELRVLSDRGRSVLAVETSFDYAHGLSAVAIVGGPELATAGPLYADDAYDDASWTTARVTLAGDSTPRRRTRHLVLPSGARVDAGAALGVGARFLGRVLHVDGRRAIAALLGDPALSFSAVAAIDGAAAPLHLGRLRSLGVDEDGAVLVEWGASADRAAPRGAPASLTAPPPDPGTDPATAPVAAPATASTTAPRRPHGRARIATSSGDRGVPAGLWVGTCTIPDGPGPHVLRIVPSQDPADLLRVRVRLGAAPVEELP